MCRQATNSTYTELGCSIKYQGFTYLEYWFKHVAVCRGKHESQLSAGRFNSSGFSAARTLSSAHLALSFMQRRRNEGTVPHSLLWLSACVTYNDYYLIRQRLVRVWRCETREAKGGGENSARSKRVSFPALLRLGDVLHHWKAGEGVRSDSTLPYYRRSVVMEV